MAKELRHYGESVNLQLLILHDFGESARRFHSRNRAENYYSIEILSTVPPFIAY